MTDSAIDVPVSATSDVARLTKVARTLSQLRADLEHAVEGAGPWDDVHPQHRQSAKNLTQYLKLRQHDVRELQISLADLGLSSLGRLESQVEATVAAVDRAVRRQLAGPDASTSATALDQDAAELDLGHNADQLLGRPRDGRRTRILVTMPSEAAHDARLVSRIVRSGIEAIRINCAHDGPAEWKAMIDNVRAAEREQQADVKVIMDLAGPKLRTGPIEAAPPVQKVKPTRDPLGRVTEPARVWLSAEGVELDDADAVGIPVDDADWLAARDIDEEIRCTDSRGSSRVLSVRDVVPGGVLCELEKTCYFVPGLELHGEDDDVARVGSLPSGEQKLKVYSGDVITLTRDLTPVDPSGGDLRIGCTLPEVFTDVATGDRVFFDDGKIGGKVVETSTDTVRIEVTEISPTGAKLGAAKGINLPDTSLHLPALTEEDVENLPFVVQHADVVSLSFVRAADDVALLHQRLRELGGDALGIILKIETVSGFENLPEILFEAMKWRSIGVMIARGDLAVEAGYEQLAEVQEEIMWLCEAAHVPVIWATQVLDNLAKTGRPSRAEVTDAAMSGRAECVMLNKGPYVGNAVTLLTGILTRMAEHHTKKRALMRRIHAWGPDR
ncbi:pyruvate kinase [Blastococcus sp. Marseille-P5729]|uniref:pyruvate kinase n=1 Tax=Blastococcus sp. Marseille-P5729 TaxID=2086582 RepID=UPI000D0E6387|nr:pyruvate kinase [Blastococcus sp. Marseille-P5729]